MDSQQVIELVKALIGPLFTTGGVLTFYLLYRRFNKEQTDYLKEDNKSLREERDAAEEKLRKEREDNDKLRAEIRAEHKGEDE